MPGPFYFAWSNPGAPPDPLVIKVEDEKIVRFRVEHLETEFATLSIDIENPRRGLLAGPIWAWLSWDGPAGWAPLFFGRVVALPTNLHREVVTLQLMARPEDYGAQKAAIADTLRVPPYYDPVFIKPEMAADPDIVLEGRTQVWHIDRTTHELSVSDLLVGEDGVLDFAEDAVPYESVEVNLDQPPVRAVIVTAEVPWTQSVAGRGLPLLRNWKVPTLAGKGMISGWPKPSTVIGGPGIGTVPGEVVKGTSMGGGWYAFEASAHSPYEELTDADWANWYLRRMAPPGKNPHPLGLGFKDPPFYLSLIQSYSASVSSSGPQVTATRFQIIADEVHCNLTLGYEADRKRKDSIQFTLVADSQPIVTMPDDDDAIELKIAGNDVGIPVGILPSPLPSPAPEPPIGSTMRRSYFATDRGMQSIQYAIQLARARIIARSRAVTVKWKCTFEQAVELSLRKNARLHDRRLPGGEALGKIVGYSFWSQGGEIAGEVTVACCIGYGGSVDALPGTPSYVDDDYVDDGYQYRDGQRVVLAASDVGFVPLAESPNDDGLVFPLRAVPITQSPHNVTTFKNPLVPVAPTTQASTQIDDCGNTSSVSVSTTVDTGPYTNWLSGIETNVEFQMKAVAGGPFETVYAVDVTDLKLPKQIDLEAPASP